MTVRRIAAVLIALSLAGCASPASPPRFVAPSSSAAGPPPKVESDNGVKGPLGDVIDTGLPAGGGTKYVIYGVTGGVVNDSSAFGFAIGARESARVVTEDLTISEYKGSASAPGFHPMQGQMEMDGGATQPAFGYYVGTPATITVVDSGRTISAKLARWSHDPGVTVFWFDPADVHDSSRWTDLGAFDSAGDRLPDGHIELSTY